MPKARVEISQHPTYSYTMKRTQFLSTLCALCTVQTGKSFSLSGTKIQATKTAPKFEQISSFSPILDVNESNSKFLSRAIATSVASVPLLYPSIVSAADDYEVAELPPVYVPILFAIGIIGGVGVLTASLGDVMDEGMFAVFFDYDYILK